MKGSFTGPKRCPTGSNSGSFSLGGRLYVKIVGTKISARDGQEIEGTFYKELVKTNSIIHIRINS